MQPKPKELEIIDDSDFTDYDNLDFDDDDDMPEISDDDYEIDDYWGEDL